MANSQEILRRIDSVIAKADVLLQSGGSGLYVEATGRSEFRTTGLALIRELCGEGAVHYTDFNHFSSATTRGHLRTALGVLRALRAEVAEGRLPQGNDQRATHSRNPRRVFVVHGRNEAARTAIFSFLRAAGLDPIEWSEAIARTGSGSPYVGDALDRAFEEAQAVVVLLTGDDIARLGTAFIQSDDPRHEKELTPQARPNVLFEAGMAFGREPRRTILVQLGEIRPFSDIFGRHIVKLSDRPEARTLLLSRLKTAGCQVDDDHRTDWLSAGNFANAICAPDVATLSPVAMSARSVGARIVPPSSESNPALTAQKSELLTLAFQLHVTVTSLPTERAKAEQIRQVTLWTDSQLATLRTLAASFGLPAATYASEAAQSLATVQSMADDVQATPRSRGFDWAKFDWERFCRRIETAERNLLNLLSEVEPEWRSLIPRSQ
jgi:predicted nucleotide-binding protein